MELFDVICCCKIMNGVFLFDLVFVEYQCIFLEVVGCVLLQLNSQLWWFVVIESCDMIDEIVCIFGESMIEVMLNGMFFEWYKLYFCFSEVEMEEKCSGMLFDKFFVLFWLFMLQVFIKCGQILMNIFGVFKMLGLENWKFVVGLLLLLGVMFDCSEY